MVSSSARWRVLAVLVAGLMGCGGGEGAADGGVFDFCPGGNCTAVDAGTFSIVVLPDTQFYSEAYPNIFKAQTDWIVAQREARRIAFVLHEGDIVNFDLEGQWQVAERSLRVLDGKVPYVLAVGNHDFSYRAGRITRECDLLNAHFPAAGLAALPWPTGTFQPGRIENSYQVLDAFGLKYVVLALEYGPRDAVVDWANAVLDRYAELPAIIVTHAYMARDGKPFTTQPFHPCGDGPNEFQDCNGGQMMWDKLISLHDNVVFVFSGHELFPGVSRLTSQQASGRHVHQILANYQTCGGLPCTIPFTDQNTEGGDGFLRIVTIDPGRGTAAVETYSPYFDALGREPYRRTDDQQFILDLDPWQFRPPAPRAAIVLASRQSQDADRLLVRTPLDRPLSEKPRPRAIENQTARACDGIQVVLPNVDATGDVRSVRRLRACLDGSCENFTIDESLVCVPDQPRSRSISCVNDEGMLRLFFLSDLGPQPVVQVVAHDGLGAMLFRGTEAISARAAPVDGEGRPCWTAMHALRADD
jgi:hypothetical protein